MCDKNNYRIILLCAIIVQLLISCAGKNFRTQFIDINLQEQVSPQSIHLCVSSRCKTTRTISFSQPEWEQIRSEFNFDHPNSASERNVIANVIAQMEFVAGKHSKIWKDQKKNFGQKIHKEIIGQLDCNAETVNTNNFLKLIESENLLKFHELDEPMYRGFSNLSAPHFTAVIREKSSGHQYAVDSWFHRNGIKPEIVPIDIWISGYKP